jgi:lipopolysaccharide biosynthesis glycosyltransferase
MRAPGRSRFGFFVVFEPSYSLGCLAALSSLVRHASRPIAVDVLMRAQYRRAADEVIDKLKRKYGDRLVLRAVVVPPAILDQCDNFNFRAHFIAEILFRLYYFDIVESRSDYVIYLDLDMILMVDIFSIEQDLGHAALLHVVEAKMQDASRGVMPPHISRYLNSGLLVFDTTDSAALGQALLKARHIVNEIAEKAQFLDQDAINIAFYDKLEYLPRKWNFTLEEFTGYPLPGDTAVLHATGSRKPWFFRGGHPFSMWYEKEADLLELTFLGRYDFWWAARRLATRLKRLPDARRLR